MGFWDWLMGTPDAATAKPGSARKKNVTHAKRTSVFGIEVGDVVTYDTVDYVVKNKISYDDEGFTWFDFTVTFVGCIFGITVLAAALSRFFLVEMKRSSGTVVHGYEKQLEFYKDASQTDWAVFVVLDFGEANLEGKLEAIYAMQRQRRANGERASDILVIDATRKASASKRE